MSGFSFKSLRLTLLIAFLVWSSNFEACIARRGRHSRQHNRAHSSSSLYKKKSKSHGSHHHKGNGSKPKYSPPHNKAAPPVYPPPPSPPPTLTPGDNDPTPSSPPPSPPKSKGYNNGVHSVSFDVLDFGAKGDGSTDDTKVCQFSC